MHAIFLVISGIMSIFGLWLLSAWLFDRFSNQEDVRELKPKGFNSLYHPEWNSAREGAKWEVIGDSDWGLLYCILRIFGVSARRTVSWLGALFAFRQALYIFGLSFGLAVLLEVLAWFMWHSHKGWACLVAFFGIASLVIGIAEVSTWAEEGRDLSRD